MAAINLGTPEEGLQDFTFGSKTITVDVLDVMNYLVKLKENADKFEGENNLVKDVGKYLIEKGFTDITDYHVIVFIKCINVLANQLKKNIEQKQSLLPPTVD